MTSLRDRLRADTASRHERVDHLYTSLDLTQRDDLRDFLHRQLEALESMRSLPGRHATAAEDLRSRMSEAMKADLHVLGIDPASPRSGRQLDATSMLYILLGSSLGTQVLRRRWLQATDPAVSAAGQYLSLSVPAGAWRQLCQDLAGQEPDGAEADRIVQDACEIFDLHLDASSNSERLPEGASHV